MRDTLKKAISVITKFIVICVLMYLCFWWPSKAMQTQSDLETNLEIAEQAETQTAAVIITKSTVRETETESRYGTETQENAEAECETEVPESEVDELREADKPYEDVPEHEHEYYYAGFCEGEGELWCCEICMDSVTKPCSHRYTYCVDCGEELE